MKKWYVGFAVLLVVLAVVIYVFSPASVSFSKSTVIAARAHGLFRTLHDEDHWADWWPGEQTSPGVFTYQGRSYSVTDKGIGSLEVSIQDGKELIMSSIDFVTTAPDSVQLIWHAKGSSTLNPLKRISRLAGNGSPAAAIAELLDTLRKYYSSEQHVYGLKIHRITVPDTALVSTFRIMDQYPSIPQVYEMLDKVKQYAVSQAAGQTGNPMLNVSTINGEYLVRVAIPVDKRLAGSGDISYKWMLPGGLMCMAEVTGGPHTTDQAMTTVENYVKDHEWKQPVIPFQSLITDRRTEPDTSKWKTKIFCPYF